MRGSIQRRGILSQRDQTGPMIMAPEKVTVDWDENFENDARGKELVAVMSLRCWGFGNI
jgi:hypothetical protein